MKVIIVFVFLKLTLVMSEDLPCNKHLTVNITKGKRTVNNEIVFNNVTYPKSDYYEENNNGILTIYGCLCNIHACVRKCCPFGYGHTGSGCTKTDKFTETNFTLPVYEDKEIISSNYKFNYVVGNSCHHNGYILFPEKYNSDFHFLQQDGTLYMPIHESTVATYRPPEEFCMDYNVTSEKNQIVTLVCFGPQTLDATSMYKYGMLISMPFLLVTLLVYACVPDLQNIHGKCLICYVISLLTAYLFLVSVQLDTSKTDSNFCHTAPFIIYFAFMASFMWLHVMCLDIWWTFSGLRGYKGSAKKSEQKRFLLYNLYAWGVPVVMLSVTLALQFAKDLPDWVITPQIAVTKCWFPDDKTLGAYFYGPILLIIVANLVLFGYTTYKIWIVQRTTDQSMNKNESQRHGNENDKQRFKLYLKLMFVFGVNWLMEIISWLAHGPQWLWYVTDMCNALYGVFIFFIFVCKANVWKLVRKRYHVMMGRPYHAKTLATTSSTRSTGVSSASTANVPRDSFALSSSTA